MSSRLTVFFFLVVAVLTRGADGAQRTFVSAGSGSDANPCSRQQPCRNFTAALLQTDPGGEVVVLDSGGYGVVSVTKSVSLISPAGVHAGISPVGPTGDAVSVNVDNAVVILRGLTLNGSLGGVHGISFTGQIMSASNTRLYVENCTISSFLVNGLNFARNGILFVSDTTVRQSGNVGIFIDGSPTLPSSGSIAGVRLEGNSDGLVVDNATVAVRDTVATANTSRGFWAAAFPADTVANLSVDNCQASHSLYGFLAGSGSGIARLTVSNSVAMANADGIEAQNNGSVRASNNTVTRNNNGLVQVGTSLFESRGNNAVRDNTFSNAVGTITPFGPM